MKFRGGEFSTGTTGNFHPELTGRRVGYSSKWNPNKGSLDRCSPESTFWLDSNSKPHLLRASAARKRGLYRPRLHFLASGRASLGNSLFSAI